MKHNRRDFPDALEIEQREPPFEENPLFHPITRLFPVMKGDLYAALKDDIEANGQCMPILTYKEQIVDGRHRWRACRELGIEPHYQEWDSNGSLLQIVVGLNLHHHHYEKSQRAFIALDLMPQFAEEAKARQLSGLKRGAEPVAQQVEPQGTGRAATQAAKIVGVSPLYVYHAQRITKESPELAKQCRAGELTISKALSFLGQAQKEQGKPVTFSGRSLSGYPAIDWPYTVAAVKAAIEEIAGFVSQVKKDAPRIPALSRPEIAKECSRGAHLLDQLAKEMGGGANGLPRSAQGNNP